MSMRFNSSAIALALSTAAALVSSHASSQGGAAAEPPVPVVDLHVDVPYQVHFKSQSPTLSGREASAVSLKAGGYAGMVFPIYMHPVHKDGSHVDDADKILESIERIIEASQAFTPLGASAADPGRISSFLAIEGAGAFATDVARIDHFIKRGVRFVGPVHAANNDFASAATGKPTDVGLTPLGKEFCARVYERGALIDVSHLSDKGFADLVPIAKAHGAPIVATHSNARAVANHPRNLTDEELRVIGETGGVAGLNFHSPFVSSKEKPTLEDVLAQLDHMIAVAGIEHVAIGSDFDGGITPAVGLEDASKLQVLAARLRKRGMPREDVLKIFALNALRVIAWRPRASLNMGAGAAR